MIADPINRISYLTTSDHLIKLGSSIEVYTISDLILSKSAEKVRQLVGFPSEFAIHCSDNRADLFVPFYHVAIIIP